eukprot:TRINITY_DN11888_c0_g1_i1.p1 TRINITY_DN11888_c0_g1~~TRINITY_DN11888_c0_g1_i1.p1  ORF type:complete len:347 (+),score=44.01 TRINITY_DN11888_c0_g1_i1:35-1042(+)
MTTKECITPGCSQPATHENGLRSYCALHFTCYKCQKQPTKSNGYYWYCEEHLRCAGNFQCTKKPKNQIGNTWFCDDHVRNFAGRCFSPGCKNKAYNKNGEQYFCDLHLICKKCGKSPTKRNSDGWYCEEHFKYCWNLGCHQQNELIKCLECQEKYCLVHATSLSKCQFCDKTLCHSHTITCSICSQKACSLHVVRCNQCSKAFCLEHENGLLSCSICSEKFCVDDITKCSSCQKKYCGNHVQGSHETIDGDTDGFAWHLFCLNQKQNGKYEGPWYRGVRHGCGVFTWPSGFKTMREYKNGVLIAERDYSVKEQVEQVLQKERENLEILLDKRKRP